MRFHVEALAVEQMLARMMEVKLQQLIIDTSQVQLAAGGHIDFDVVPVVPDVQRHFLVVNPDRPQ